MVTSCRKENFPLQLDCHDNPQPSNRSFPFFSFRIRFAVYSLVDRSLCKYQD